MSESQSTKDEHEAIGQRVYEEALRIYAGEPWVATSRDRYEKLSNAERDRFHHFLGDLIIGEVFRLQSGDVTPDSND